MARTGRPKREFDIKQFNDLIGLGCTQDEIAWWFRDEHGKPANIDTLSRWCKRTFGLNFQDYMRKNGGMYLKVGLRKNQFELSKRNAAMAIFLGKNYLGQTDHPEGLNTADALLQNMQTLTEVLSTAAPNRNIEDFEE